MHTVFRDQLEPVLCHPEVRTGLSERERSSIGGDRSPDSAKSWFERPLAALANALAFADGDHMWSSHRIDDHRNGCPIDICSGFLGA